MDDSVLLREYSEDRSEAAFTELVRRHVNLVYFAALRQLGGNETLAEDVTQLVFTDLARKARHLTDRPVLAGWLHTSTRFAASKVRRGEARRRARETQACVMESRMHEDGVAEWERLRPVIDEALHTLDEIDREAVLLRFFEDRPFAEIGKALRLTEEAARKRVDRGLHKLERAIAQHGITSTAAALATALGAQAGATAPTRIGESAAAAALSSAGIVSPATLAAVLLVVAIVTGAALWQVRALRDSTSALADTRRQQQALRSRAEQVGARVAETRSRLREAESDYDRLRAAIEAASLAGIVEKEASRAAFVLDTSGSMRDPKTGAVYAVVLARIDEILAARSELKYFQLFDADGRVIVADTAGKWLPNNAETRALSRAALLGYRQDTVSNPLPGIVRALEALDAARDPLSRLHIHIFGDEFNASEHSDLALAQIEELNPADAENRRRITISAVAFSTWRPLGVTTNSRPVVAMVTDGRAVASRLPPAHGEPAVTAESPRTYLRFHRLMKEVARRHGGTFSIVDDFEAR